MVVGLDCCCSIKFGIMSHDGCWNFIARLQRDIDNECMNFDNLAEIKSQHMCELNM